MKKFFQKEDAIINLTPLIDVIFVVLVAFILIASLLEVEKIHLAASSEISSENIEENQIKIYVKEDESIWIGKKQIFLKNLSIFLKDLKETYPEKKIQLYQDKKSSFGLYQEIKKIVKLSGYKTMDVILKRDETF